MRILTLIITTFVCLFVNSAVFAMDRDDNKQCNAIAEACKNAGYTNEGTDDKSFWFGCLKPVLYGKTVAGLTIGANDVKECRHARIEQMKKELKELQAVK